MAQINEDSYTTDASTVHAWIISRIMIVITIGMENSGIHNYM